MQRLVDPIRRYFLVNIKWQQTPSDKSKFKYVESKSQMKAIEVLRFSKSLFDIYEEGRSGICALKLTRTQ